MQQTLQKTTGIKVTFYTHPLCKTSWEMQPDWADFYREYYGLVAFKFCMGEVMPEHDGLSKAPGMSQMCLAVKAASLQSEAAAYLYLTALREAVWVEGLEASGLDVLVNIARKVSQNNRTKFDLGRFGIDFTGKPACKALKEDLRKFHINRVGVLPTITITRDRKGLKLERYANYMDLVKTVCRLAPSLIADANESGAPGEADR